MMLYALICLSLSLVGVAGLQFFYLMYLERMNKIVKVRIHQIERENLHLKHSLHDAELQIAEQAKLIEAAYQETEDEEVWADVIEER